VWEGSPAELEGPHATAVARLSAEGHAPIAARAVTRTISVVDRLLVLASVSVGDDGQARLEPPDGGFLITPLELDAAMRLLGGRRRRQLGLAIGAAVVGAMLVAVGLGGAAIARLAGA
jgi:hypothetical protein